MERRSFLRALCFAPIAIPVAVKAAGQSPITSFTITADRIVINRDDMVVDGAITAKKISVGNLTAISASFSPTTPGILRA